VRIETKADLKAETFAVFESTRFRHHGAIKLTQNQGRIQEGATGAIAPPKTCESIFIHHNFRNSENNIGDISPFRRLFFCHSSSVVKYTSSLLQ